MLDGITLNNGTLSQAQKDQYWQDGYLFPMTVADTDQVQHWRAELEQMEAEWLDNGLPQPLNTYKRVNAQCVMPLAYEIGTYDPILDVVESVLGPDTMLYSVEFLIKEPHTKHVVTMHQDLTYWGMGEIDGILTAWVALSDATPQSGCMDFVKGSHKNPILPHKDTFDDKNLLSRGQEIAVDVAPEDKVAVELNAGQMSLHHGLTIHGSGPNSSDERRIGAVIRYISPDVVKTQGGQDYAMLTRGTKPGHFKTYPAPKAYFDTEGLKIYEEIRAMQAQVMMAGAQKNQGFYAGTTK